MCDFVPSAGCPDSVTLFRQLAVRTPSLCVTLFHTAGCPNSVFVILFRQLVVRTPFL